MSIFLSEIFFHPYFSSSSPKIYNFCFFSYNCCAVMLIFFFDFVSTNKRRRFFRELFYFETLFVTYRTHAKKSYVCVIVIFWGKIHISLNRFFFMIFFVHPNFFFRDSFPFVLGREQFLSFFLTRKSVCVLKEIRNKKLTSFLLLC